MDWVDKTAVFFLLWAGWNGTPHAAAAEPSRYALIVANNAGLEASQAPLRFADDDGALYYEMLSPQMDEVALLSVLDAETQRRYPGLAARTTPPTHQALREVLGRLNARMAQDREQGRTPVLYFIFTGHGMRDPAGEGMVSLLDGPFTRTELFRDVISPSPAELIHLIVDACDSYFFVNARGSLPQGAGYGQAVREFLDDRALAKYPKVGVVLSTSGAQESHEWSAIGAGIFSHQVRSALAGAADVNGDGKIEYSELSAFVAAANRNVQDARGRVNLWVQPPARNQSAELVDLRQRSGLGFLLVPGGTSGRWWIEDERGIRLVEFNREPDHPVVLALPYSERRYYLRSRWREASFRLSTTRSVVDAKSLVWTDTLAERGSVQESFQENMFGTPFGWRFYEGYMSSLGELPVAPPEEPDASP